MFTINTFPEGHKLYHKVANSLIGHKRLLLSYSGGLDSTVLLDILAILINSTNNLTSSVLILRAIYVHNSISNHANNWANHCSEQCKRRNAPFLQFRYNLLYKNTTLDTVKTNIKTYF